MIGNVTGKDGITLNSSESVWFDDNGHLGSAEGNINISTSGFRKVVSSNYFDPVDNTHRLASPASPEHKDATGLADDAPLDRVEDWPSEEEIARQIRRLVGYS